MFEDFKDKIREKYKAKQETKHTFLSPAKRKTKLQPMLTMDFSE